MSKTEVFENQRADSEKRYPALSNEPLGFHRRFDSYAATPLVDAPALAAELGVGRVLVKDESSRLGLPSFKMLGASYASYRALDKLAGGSLFLDGWQTIEQLSEKLSSHLPLTLVAATDGNHGRAVARIARLLGLGAQIYVPAGTAKARIEAIRSEGATCEVVDGSYDEAVARSAKDVGPRHLVISDTSWPGYEEVPAWVIEGYSTIFFEIDEQLKAAAQPDAVFVPIGVGALASAAVRAFRQKERAPGPLIVGVEPLSAACLLSSVRAGRLTEVPGPHRSMMAGLNCGRPSEIAYPVVEAGVDVFVAIDDEPVKKAMCQLAAAGVVSGETGAAALAGASELVAATAGKRARPGLGPAATVLLLSSEGATDEAAYETIVGRKPVEVAAPS